MGKNTHNFHIRALELNHKTEELNLTNEIASANNKREEIRTVSGVRDMLHIPGACAI